MPTNRFSLVVVLSAIAALALLTVSMVALPHGPGAVNSASSSYRQVEHVRTARN